VWLGLTPTGRRTAEYLAGVFIVRVHHKPFGQRQLAFVRVETDERRFAAVIHFSRSKEHARPEIAQRKNTTQQ